MRRNTDGFIENSTCVNNTASEHFMVERMIVDDILHWVVDYKVFYDIQNDGIFSSFMQFHADKTGLFISIEHNFLMFIRLMDFGLILWAI